MTFPVRVWDKRWRPGNETEFRLRSNSFSSAGFNPGAPDVYGPQAQVWTASIPIPHLNKRETLQVQAFFSQLGGIAGLLRMFDPKRIRPGRLMGVSPTPETWGDGTAWLDGTGWSASWDTPPTVPVHEAAASGATSVVISGLPASMAGVLWAGDLIEFRPGGIAAQFGMLHEVAFDAQSDANGRSRVYLNPPLRAGIAAGDVAVLNFASTVFRCVNDDQGVISQYGGGAAGTGFSLIEVISR